MTSIYCSKKSCPQKFITPNTFQLNGSFHQYWKTKKCLHVCARASEKGGKMKLMSAPNSQSQSQMNEPVFCRYWNNATNFKKSNKIERFLYEWRKIMTLLRCEESNRIINTLLDGWPANNQYGWVFLLVELYFGSPLVPSRKNPHSYWLVNCLMRYIYTYSLL